MNTDFTTLPSWMNGKYVATNYKGSSLWSPRLHAQWFRVCMCECIFELKVTRPENKYCLTWRLCVHHRGRWTDCAMIRSRRWSKRISAWWSWLLGKWLKRNLNVCQTAIRHSRSARLSLIDSSSKNILHFMKMYKTHIRNTGFKKPPDFWKGSLRIPDLAMPLLRCLQMAFAHGVCHSSMGSTWKVMLLSFGGVWSQWHTVAQPDLYLPSPSPPVMTQWNPFHSFLKIEVQITYSEVHKSEVYSWVDFYKLNYHMHEDTEEITRTRGLPHAPKSLPPPHR